MFLKGNDKEHVLRFFAEHTKIINLKKKQTQANLFK